MPRHEDTPAWQQVAQGVCNTTTGQPGKVNLLSKLRLSLLQTIDRMDQTYLPVEKGKITFEIRGHKTYIRFPRDTNKKICGPGRYLNIVEPQRRILRLHIDHYGARQWLHTYAGIIFCIVQRLRGIHPFDLIY